ncbi:TonB-dependent siderophore receptor [Pseudothauera rhizosphaerae]|nr:TonB-dependent receptor [Pseudothauera rhizosphaerae]
MSRTGSTRLARQPARTHTFARHPLALALQLALTGGLLATLAWPAEARAQGTATEQAVARRYDIPAGPLSAVLTQFATEAGIFLAGASELAQGRQSSGVHGTYDVQGALDALLAGTGLEAFRQTDGKYGLRPAPVIDKRGEAVLAPVAVTAERVRDAVSEGSGSYAARAASIAKGNQRLKDIPQSVSVMTRQRIDDQNLATVNEVLLEATGIASVQTGNPQGEGRSSTYFSRGYQIENYMINGAPVNTGRGEYGDSIANGSSGIYDRVEILRGAAGLLVGNGQPGAVINLERKRPLAQDQTGLLFSVASWDKYRVEGDVSRVLNESGSVRGRLVASYEDSDRFWKLTNSKSPLLYGVLDIDLGSRTTLSIGGLYEKYKETGRWATILQGDKPLPNFSRSDNPAGRDWTYYDKESKEYFATLEHQFNDDWKARANFTHQTSTVEFKSHTIYVSAGTWPNYQLRQSNGLQVLYRLPSDTTNIAFDGNVVGNFELFGRAHELVAGANWFNTKSENYTNWFYPWQDRHNTFIDVREGLNDSDYLPDPAIPDTVRRGDKVDSSRYGAYSTLRLSLADPLKLILGARLSYYDHEVRNWQTGVLTQDRHVDAELTPFAGIVYELTDQWSAYGSYADIFNPQFGQYTASGGSLDPVIGANYELGIKGELYGGALNLSAALFRIDETGRAQVDPRWPDANVEPCPGNPTGGVCHYNGGERRSEGVEVEVNGELLPGWQAGIGYTYNTTKVVKDRNNFDLPTNAQGKPYSQQTPRHLLRAWSTYRFSGDWARLRVGGGVSAQSETADNWNYRTEPGRSVWSLFGAYEIDRIWSVAANINNVFDKEYYLTGSAGIGRWGEPRSISVSLRGKF